MKWIYEPGTLLTRKQALQKLTNKIIQNEQSSPTFADILREKKALVSSLSDSHQFLSEAL